MNNPTYAAAEAAAERNPRVHRIRLAALAIAGSTLLDVFLIFSRRHGRFGHWWYLVRPFIEPPANGVSRRSMQSRRTPLPPFDPKLKLSSAVEDP